MNAERIERLKERFRYREWAGGTERPPIAEVVVEGLLAQEWRVDHVDRVEQEGHPPGWLAVWRAARGEQAVALDLYRCASAGEAREYLLRLLDQFQSPHVVRIEGREGVGDVAFAPPGDRALVFVAANVVALVRSVGREPVGVRAIAAGVAARLERPAAG
jgi:hypothetical protein